MARAGRWFCSLRQRNTSRLSTSNSDARRRNAIMKSGGLRLLFFVLVLGCSKPAPAPKMEKVQFPVVVLFESSSVRACSGPDELKRMHTNNLTLNNEPPHLVDSRFNIFRMENLRSVHGGLWLMANPVAM